MPTNEEIEQVALRAARAAGRVHLQRLRNISVTRKTNAIDLVTEADREAEAAAIAVLRRAYPDHAILAEESGTSETPAGGGADRWIIDPLDGTTNFAHNYPQFCVSIAYLRHNRAQVGVIFDALKREMFVARRGAGAWLNGTPLHVTRTARLDSALLVSGFPYDRRERRRFYLAYWEGFMMRTHGVRRSGSAALDLAWVACGRADGFWEFGLKPWDVAAGALLVTEAGGRVSNFDGSPMDLGGAQILATNGRLHRQMLAAMAAIRPEAEQRHAAMLLEESAANAPSTTQD